MRQRCRQQNRRQLSRASEAIEALASRIAESRARQAAWRGHERQFSELLRLLAPRIAGLIRQYGLGDMREDAQQAAAIGVHRALAGFEPARASFSTHVTWQMRGELQSLRHRMRLDQRRSAASAGATTVSLDALSEGETMAFEIVDEASLAYTESGASDSMAGLVMHRLLDRLSAPKHERSILFSHLYETAPLFRSAEAHTPEQRRQIVRRTMRNCAKLVAAS